MRTILTVLAVIALAGCSSGSTGPFALIVKDAPGNIDDFTSLTVSVDKITLTGKDNKSSDVSPATPTFDLTKLTSGNTSTLFNGSVPSGDYERLDIHFSDAKGVLKSGGASIDVKAPSNRIFLNTPYTISPGNETNFVFDIEVHKVGNGDYQFKPNADASGPKHK